MINIFCLAWGITGIIIAILGTLGIHFRNRSIEYNQFTESALHKYRKKKSKKELKKLVINYSEN